MKSPVLATGHGKQKELRKGNGKGNTELPSSVCEITSQCKSWNYVSYTYKGLKNSSWLTCFFKSKCDKRPSWMSYGKQARIRTTMHILNRYFLTLFHKNAEGKTQLCWKHSHRTHLYCHDLFTAKKKQYKYMYKWFTLFRLSKRRLQNCLITTGTKEKTWFSWKWSFVWDV